MSTDTTTARQGDVTYLSLWTPDTQRAATFYAAVLGWRLDAGPRHAQVTGLSVNQGVHTAPAPTTFVCFAVDDVDRAADRVRAAGGTAGEPTDMGDGRILDCRDDQGWAFALHTPDGGTAAPDADRPAGRSVDGDTVYLTHETPDVERLTAFLGAVLGWEFSPGSVEHGWGVVGDVRPMTGLHGGADAPRTDPMYQVADIEAAVAAVRAHGGEAGDPFAQPYGTRADAVDDQGARFYLLG